VFEDRDRYAEFYTEHLWALLPEIYRTSDTDSDEPTVHGPLRELVVRLGAQVAIVRRAIDRTREDQSIESCDDWLIPYLGDLLATRIVAGLDARAQRLDVANTIYYRRRKGTVAILEEIAADITNWNVRVVEFFRRLGRTRHGFDPAIGLDRGAAVIDGLRGARSGTPVGGFADLRHAGAAQCTRTAFDEYFHTADFRRGRARSGWYNIPKLGVFLWRLKSFPEASSTPVEDVACPGQFTFDPTGREVPLFARDFRVRSEYGDAWVTPDEWMLPGPISKELFAREQARLYPESLVVVDVSAAGETNVPAANAGVVPQRGRFEPTAAAAPGVNRRVRYHHGFSSEIGAGPYDRRAAGEAPLAQPAPMSVAVSGGGNALQGALAALGATGTLSIADSLTYTAVNDVLNFTDILLQAGQNQRPVVRLNGGAWTFQGGAGANLAFEGLFVSGADIVLTGTFDTVTLSCSSLDPGEEVQANGALPRAVDGRDLHPGTIWIEGVVAHLVVRRVICGPIRTRFGGAVQKVSIADSIVQGVRTSIPGPLVAADLSDPQQLLRLLRDGRDPLGVFLRGQLSAATSAALAAYDPTTLPGVGLIGQIVTDLNAVIGGASIYSVARFADVTLPPRLADEASAGPPPAERPRVNRLLLESAYALALAPAAIACGEAEVSIERTTVLGQVFAHRISASESILAGFAAAEDAQDGCVRFTAYVDGSALHQPYESVTIAERAAIFVTARFGQPGYAQLGLLADREILTGTTIRAGAKNGSEMGAFARELYAIKERGLQIKLGEFMPIGLTPVLIHVT
jgi:hypothetical protein